MTMLRDKLEAKAKEITSLWKFSDVDVIFDGHPYAHLEAVLHELCHAVCLDVPLNEETPFAVARIIRSMDSKPLVTHTDAALREEAKAWAVEWELIQRLKLPFEWGDVVEGAAIQGVDAVMLEPFIGSRTTRELADKTLEILEAA